MNNENENQNKLKKLKKENLDLLIEKAKLKKQIERLMKVIKFLTEGE